MVGEPSGKPRPSDNGGRHTAAGATTPGSTAPESIAPESATPESTTPESAVTSPTPTAGSPGPATAASPGDFVDDFESGTLDDWRLGECRQDYACTVVADPAGGGDQAVRISQRENSPPGPNNSHRAEIRLPGVEPDSEWW